MRNTAAEVPLPAQPRQPWQAPVLKAEEVHRVTGNYSGNYFDGGHASQPTPPMRNR